MHNNKEISETLQKTEEFRIGHKTYNVQMPVLDGMLFDTDLVEGYFDQLVQYCDDNEERQKVVEYFSCFIVKLYKKKEYDLALECAQLSIQKFPTDSGLYFLYSLILMELGHIKDARDVMESAENIDTVGDVQPFASVLAGALMMEKSWMDGIKKLIQSVDLFNDVDDEEQTKINRFWRHGLLLNLGILAWPTERPKYYKKALAITEYLDEQFAIQCFLAHSHLRNRDYKKALSVYEKALCYEIQETDYCVTDFQKMYLEIAFCYQKELNYVKAKEFFEKAINQSYKNGEVYYHYALLEMELDEYEKSLSLLNKAIQIDNYSHYYFMKHQLLVILGDDEGASIVRDQWEKLPEKRSALEEQQKNDDDQSRYALVQIWSMFSNLDYPFIYDYWRADAMNKRLLDHSYCLNEIE